MELETACVVSCSRGQPSCGKMYNTRFYKVTDIRVFWVCSDDMSVEEGLKHIYWVFSIGYHEKGGMVSGSVNKAREDFKQKNERSVKNVSSRENRFTSHVCAHAWREVR